jgi:thiamine-phosphate diphosphorylase
LLPELRRHVGPQRWLGTSVHSFDEAWQAKNAGVDYVILGSIFHSPKTDQGHPLIGTHVLQQCTESLNIPVYAIGGITSKELPAVKLAGARGFCVLRALYEAPDIEHTVTKLQMLWEHL